MCLMFWNTLTNISLVRFHEHSSIFSISPELHLHLMDTSWNLSNKRNHTTTTPSNKDKIYTLIQLVFFALLPAPGMARNMFLWASVSMKMEWIGLHSPTECCFMGGFAFQGSSTTMPQWQPTCIHSSLTLPKYSWIPSSIQVSYLSHHVQCL